MKFVAVLLLLACAVPLFPAEDLRSLILQAIELDEQKRYAEAEPLYQRALKLAPGAPAVLNNAANHWLAMGKVAEAKAAFLKVVAVEPRHTNANLQLANIAAEKKQGAEVLRRLANAGQAGPAIDILRARALHWTGQKTAAAKTLADVEAKAAGDPRIDFGAGMVYAEWKQYDRAAESFTRALNADPTNRDILYNLALASLNGGRRERARELLRGVLRRQPGDVDALYALARSYAEEGNNEMALLPLVEARKIAPQRADVLEFLARASDALGYFGDAAAAYTEYLKLRPENDIVRRERGFCLVRANRLEEGLKDLNWYVARHPKDPVGIYELAISESVHSPEDAFTRINQALALKPDYAAALFTRGSIHLQLNRPEEAIKDFERVLAQDPDNVRALDRLGQAWGRLDQPEKAIAPLERAAKLAPSDSKVLTHYSQALRSLERFDEARAVLEKFRQIPAETRRIPFGGMLDFLSLPQEQQRERYFEGLQRSVSINPENPDLQMRLGNELLARGKDAEALEAYRRAASDDASKTSAIARTLLGYKLYAPAREFLEKLPSPTADERLDLAIAVFHASGPEAGLELLDRTPEPDRQGDYWLLRAQILDAMGRFDAAVESLNRGFRAAPHRADLYLEAGQFLLKHRKYAETIALVDQALPILPDAPELRLLRAIALELSRRTDDALKELARMQVRWPEWDRTHLVRGIILNVNRKPAEARAALETAIALGANTAEAYYFLALSITEAAPEETAAAQKATARALELNPGDPYVRGLAGKLALAAGDYKTAIGHLGEAVRIFPDFFQAHYNLANAYRAAGDEDRALAEMKEVRRLREGRTKEELELVTPPLGEVLFGVGR
ncbi:MAG: tetratricopeptide repeat protein [Acidobacteriota bacterium]